jgi:hypothetical protein
MRNSILNIIQCAIIIIIAGCEEFPVINIDNSCHSYTESVDQAFKFIDLDHRYAAKHCDYSRGLRQDVKYPCLYCIDSREFEGSSGPYGVKGVANYKGDVAIFIDRSSKELYVPIIYHELAHFCGYPYDHPSSVLGDWLYSWVSAINDHPTANDVKNIEKYCHIESE